MDAIVNRLAGLPRLAATLSAGRMRGGVAGGGAAMDDRLDRERQDREPSPHPNRLRLICCKFPQTATEGRQAAGGERSAGIVRRVDSCVAGDG